MFKIQHLCRLTLVAAAFALAGCDPTPKEWKNPNMTALSPRLQSAFEKTKTVCFGRFMIDVPESATVAWGGADIPLGMQVNENEADQLETRITEREAALKAEPRYPRSKGLSLHLETIDGVLSGQKIVISQETFMSEGLLRMDAFFRMGPHLVIQEARPIKEEKLETIAELNDLARRLRPRTETEIPSDPGVCIEHAFLADKPETGKEIPLEHVRIGFRLKEFPDAHLSIYVAPSNPDASEGNSLEWQLNRLEHDLKATDPLSVRLKTKYLRRGQRHINDWLNGFEALSRTPDQSESRSHHDFAIDVKGAANDLYKPRADIRFQSGIADNAAGSVKPSLTDEEAVALWDKLIASIRVRPTGATPAKTSEAVPTPQLPLGELATTGLACPQTGWWQCAETGEVQGGRRQRLMAGEPMPHAVLLGESNVWQKLKGERPMHKTATVWKLVDYDEPQKSADAPTAAPMPTIAQAVTDDSETKEPSDGTANDALPAQDARKDNNNDAADSSKA